MATPFCTIQAAVDSPLTGPGTTVLIAGDTTYQESVDVTKSGTPGHPITLRSAWLDQWNRATVEGAPAGSAGAAPSVISVTGQHDVVIDGLRIAAQSGVGVSVTGGSSNVAIIRDLITPGVTGVSIEGAGPGVTVASDVIEKGLGDGPGVRVDHTAGVAVTGDTVDGNCGHGIEIGAGATGTTVENDVVQGNASAILGNCSSRATPSDVQISLASADSIHLDDNIVYPATTQAGVATGPVYSVAGQLYSTAADLTAKTGLGAHDLVTDARFAPPDNGEYTPAEGSPAVDSADANAVGEYATDVSGNAAVDDPLVGSSGAGIRDRGAVELTHALNPMLTVTIDKSVGITPTTVTMTVTSRSWTPVASYSYDFRDGTVLTSTKPQMRHTYTTPGSYPVLVTALDAQGNVITDQEINGSVDIWGPVKPELRLSPVSHNPMAVTANTIGTTGALTQRVDFGDGTAPQSVVSADENITHVYAKPGRYTVTLSATDVLGHRAAPVSQTFVAVLPSATSGGSPAPIVHRIAGSDRYATSIAASQARWDAAASSYGAPDGDHARAVVLARGDTFPDALAGVPLATYRHGPLLLTDPTSLPDATLREIRRVLPADGRHTVYILGGGSAVSPSIEAELKKIGYSVVRYGGADRAATALQIAHLGLGDPAKIILATGDDFADALAAGPVASDASETVDGKPAAILLSTGAGDSEAFSDPGTAAYITARVNANGGTTGCVDPNRIMGVGGPALRAFSALPATHNQANTKFACIDGIGGKDRYETASQLAGEFGFGTSHVGIATGTTFADALSGGAYEASIGQPLLLTDPASLPSSTADALKPVFDGWGAWPRSVVIFGGPSAVSDAVRDQIVATVHGRLE